MSQATLLASAVLSLLSAGVYAYLGYRLQARSVEPSAKLASTLFAAWWFALAATTVVTSILTLLAAFNVLDLSMMVAGTDAQLGFLAFGLGALLYYLIFVFRGKVRWPWAIILAYTAYYAVLVYWIQWLAPVGVNVHGWHVTLASERPQEGPFYLAIVILLVGPQVAAALAYFSLFFRVRSRTQRFRVAVVSWSLIVWFGAGLVASAAGLNESDGWQITSRILALLAPLAILFAFIPPEWARRRFGLEGIGRAAGPPVGQ